MKPRRPATPSRHPAEIRGPQGPSTPPAVVVNESPPHLRDDSAPPDNSASPAGTWPRSRIGIADDVPPARTATISPIATPLDLAITARSHRRYRSRTARSRVSGSVLVKGSCMQAAESNRDGSGWAGTHNSDHALKIKPKRESRLMREWTSASTAGFCRSASAHTARWDAAQMPPEASTGQPTDRLYSPRPAGAGTHLKALRWRSRPRHPINWLPSDVATARSSINAMESNANTRSAVVAEAIALNSHWRDSESPSRDNANLAAQAADTGNDQL